MHLVQPKFLQNSGLLKTGCNRQASQLLRLLSDTIVFGGGKIIWGRGQRKSMKKSRYTNGLFYRKVQNRRYFLVIECDTFLEGGYVSKVSTLLFFVADPTHTYVLLSVADKVGQAIYVAVNQVASFKKYRSHMWMIPTQLSICMWMRHFNISYYFFSCKY